MNFPIEFLYALSGLVVGFIVGLTGVGGGSLMTPVLILLFGVHPATAVGTDLLYAAITKSVGTFVYGLNKAIEWSVVRRLALGSVPAAALTLLALSFMGSQTDEVGDLLARILGGILMITAVSIVFRKQIARMAMRRRELRNSSQMLLTVLAGLVLGVLISISSVGAGAIGIAALVVLYPKLSVHRIVGSDIAHAVPLTLVAGIGHWAIGDVDWRMLLALLCGSIPGVLIASRLAPRVDERIIRWLLGIVLCIVGARLARG
ncbi:MAG: sulfite exporter TauE/SafE family protein [Nevskiaceae bacterium]|nr:sulfite exporter TauE/SafE family protein [Nevskiaceae bacterium]